MNRFQALKVEKSNLKFYFICKALTVAVDFFSALVPYFDKDSTEWSYPNFLFEMRDAILDIEPFNEDWGGLDGTWYKRYTKLANNDEV